MSDTSYVNLGRTRLNNYRVTWNNYVVGSVDKVTPDLTVQTKDIKVGSLGDVVVGKRIIALAGTVKVEAREIDRALAAAMMPWASTGSIPFLPATVHQDMYAYAQTLILHPLDLPDGTTTEDVTLLKAVPMIQWMDRDGVNDDKAIITFTPFPDRSQFPTLAYGFIGAPS